MFRSPEEQLKVLRAHAVDFISEQELLSKLIQSAEDKRPLRIKAGFDPSRPDLHLGHVVLLNRLKLFQDLGHKVLFLIGDWTARIGDPSGVDKTRPVLTEKEVRENGNTYSRQVFKVLDQDKTELCFNSSWMNKMSAGELMKLAGQSTVARMLERDDFSKRFKQKKTIAIHEFLYPLVQAWDSVVLKADVELGGTDQLFNLLMGRVLQKSQGQAPQCVLTLPVLEGLDGRLKMSKSHNNYIAIEDSPKDMFGKTMKLKDELLLSYYGLLAGTTEEEGEQLKADLKAGRLHPMKLKMDLACFLVRHFHGADLAEKAKEDFRRVFSLREGPPADIREHIMAPAEGVWICHLLRSTQLAPSSNEARRLIEGRAVEKDGTKIKDSALKVDLKKGDSFVLKAGKRRFVRIKVV